MRLPSKQCSSALAGVASAIAVAALSAGPSAASGLGQLNSALSANHAHAQQVAAALASSSRQIKVLTGQVELIDSRLAGVQSELAGDQARVRAAAAQVERARAAARRFERRLQQVKRGLAAQLVSNYEQGQSSLVDVVLESKSFGQLLDTVNFVGRAEREEQTLIRRARRDRAGADTAAVRARRSREAESKLVAAHEVQERALAGMQSVLDSRQQALADARDAQSAALAAAHSRGARLTSEIAEVKRQEAAAQRAAAALESNGAGTGAGVTGGGTTAGPAATVPASSDSSATDGADAYGQWAIPAAIVMCESGGQNDPPNSAGASGYYQIIPSTWTGFGGTGPAAYLASKQEQDVVAARIWRGGAGAQDWVCAGLVGIS